MRFDPPLQVFERWAIGDDVTVAGTSIPREGKVAMLLGSANRDPRRFDAPDEFRIDRGDQDHVTFGAGLHFCLGASLARLELEVALGRLASTFPDLSLEADPVREEGFAIRGYRAVHLSR